MVATQTRKAATGFQVSRRTARLVFDATIYKGAEVVVRLDIPVKLFIEIHDLILVEVGKQFQVFSLFGEHVLDEWNLLDTNGKPIEASGDGMSEVDFNLANLIISEWMGVATTLPAPLEQTLSGGDL
jgi:hypothetical protein